MKFVGFTPPGRESRSKGGSVRAGSVDRIPIWPTSECGAFSCPPPTDKPAHRRARARALAHRILPCVRFFFLLIFFSPVPPSTPEERILPPERTGSYYSLPPPTTCSGRESAERSPLTAVAAAPVLRGRFFGKRLLSSRNCVTVVCVFSSAATDCRASLVWGSCDDRVVPPPTVRNGRTARTR